MSRALREENQMKMRKRAAVCLLSVLIAAGLAAGCGREPVKPAPAAGESGGVVQAPEAVQIPAEETAAPEHTETDQAAETEETHMVRSLHLYINDAEVSVVWEDNEAVRTLVGLAADEALTVQMSMYGGFEQVGPLGTRLPQNDVQTTTQAGDIVLYSGDKIVVFYGSNSWTYTRLGRITDRSGTEMKELLGNGDVTITLAVK